MDAKLLSFLLLVLIGGDLVTGVSSLATSDNALQLQLSCMVDYLQNIGPQMTHIFVDVPLTNAEQLLLLRLLSSRLLFVRLHRGSPAAALKREVQPGDASQLVWLVPESDRVDTRRLFDHVRGDDSRYWLLVSLSGRRGAQFLDGYAARHAYMIGGNGTTRFHSARDFHRGWEARGECRAGRYVQLRQVDGLAESRGAMRGVHLRLLFGQEDRPVGEDRLEMLYGNNTITGGVMGSLFLMMQQVLGFTYSMHPVRAEGNTSVWDQLVWELHKGRGDMMAGRLMVSSARLALIDFSRPMLTELAGAAIASQHTLTLTDFRVSQPLTTPVWTTLIVTQILAAVVFWVITHYQLRLRRTQSEPVNDTSSSFWALTVLGVSCQQGVVMNSDSSRAHRIAASFFYFLSLMILTCYSGNLLAEMAIARRAMPFMSLDVALNTGWQVSNIGLSMAVRERVVQPLLGRDVPDLPVTSATPLQGRNIHLAASSVAEKTWNCSDGGRDETCSVCLWPYTLVRVPSSLAFRPHFPYLQLFNDLIPQLIDRGIVAHERTRWQSRRSVDMVCPTDSISPQKTKLGLSNLSHIFEIFGIGLACSIVVVTCENMVASIRKKYSLPSNDNVSWQNSMRNRLMSFKLIFVSKILNRARIAV